MSSSPVRRRWFQFSLGTMLLLVALVAVWLGRERQIVQERAATLRWVTDNGGREEGDRSESEISALRRWMGDKPAYYIVSPPTATEDEHRRLMRLFPEAYVWPPEIPASSIEVLP